MHDTFLMAFILYLLYAYRQCDLCRPRSPVSVAALAFSHSARREQVVLDDTGAPSPRGESMEAVQQQSEVRSNWLHARRFRINRPNNAQHHRWHFMGRPVLLWHLMSRE